MKSQYSYYKGVNYESPYRYEAILNTEYLYLDNQYYFYLLGSIKSKKSMFFTLITPTVHSHNITGFVYRRAGWKDREEPFHVFIRRGIQCYV